MAGRNVRADENMYKHHESTEGLSWRDPTCPPFALEGFPFFEENQNFCRLPTSIMPRQRESLQWVSWQPSGGVIRFVTDADVLAIRVSLDREEHFPRNPLAQESGFDLYLGSGTSRRFHANLSPENVQAEYTDECALPGGKQEVTLYFPLLNPVNSIEVGLPAGAVLEAPPSHARGKLCFYGSSITQGFCCSRPGLTYPAQIGRALDAELVNMGFGGNARGDLDVADAIAAIDMELFVLDYDFNSPPPELAVNHEPFFKRIRAVHKELPIIMASAPNWWNDTTLYARRLAATEATFNNARAAGDTNVYLIRGSEFWPRETALDCTVDRIHPNDRGLWYMAKRIKKEIDKAIGAP